MIAASRAHQCSSIIISRERHRSLFRAITPGQLRRTHEARVAHERYVQKWELAHLTPIE